MRDAASIHTFEQLGARLNDVADIVVRYRRRLVEGGMPEADAAESARALEERLLSWTIGRCELEDMIKLTEG